MNKITYVNGVTVIGATNLNEIQDEIISNGEAIAENKGKIKETRSESTD